MSTTDFVKIPWNKHEVVLLVDAYLGYKRSVISRERAVKLVSHRLRFKFQQIGVPISSAYRNETGISMQMSAIEFLFTDGQSGISHCSNLFREIVALYRDDISSFEVLLAEAKDKYPCPPGEDDESIALYLNSAPEDSKAGISHDEKQAKYMSRKLKDILIQKFSRGYKLGSYMEANRLKKFYLDAYGEELDMEHEDIDKDVESCGIEYEGRVYIPEQILPNELKLELLEFIESFFRESGDCLYYTVLFSHFRDRFLDTHILNESMLRQFLEYINNDGWFFNREYLSNSKNASVDVFSKVLQFVKDQGGVVSKDEAVTGLSSLPENQVRDAFDERNTKLVSCGRNQRFHLDNFVISEEELDAISEIINHAIANYKYITFNELLNDMKSRSLNVVDNNVVFTELGIRNALSALLGDKFNFFNSIISSNSETFRPEDAFRELSKRDEFTIDDVCELATACNSLANIYIGLLLEDNVRLDKIHFVSKSKMAFDVDATDEILLRICDKDYIAISDVEILSALPSCNYSWTPFLLESYAATHSKAFHVLHASYFGQKHPIGAIVKNGSPIKDFNTLAATAIVDAGVRINKVSALDFLCDKMYIVQHRYEGIDEVLAIAHQLISTRKKS